MKKKYKPINFKGWKFLDKEEARKARLERKKINFKKGSWCTLCGHHFTSARDFYTHTCDVQFHSWKGMRYMRL